MNEIRMAPTSEAGDLALAITNLPPFERFVYVISVLEGYPDRECALLLSCTPGDVVNAKVHAFEHLANVSLRNASVTVLERDQIGKAASYGNAGSIAPEHPPINKPGRVRQAVRS